MIKLENLGNIEIAKASYCKIQSIHASSQPQVSLLTATYFPNPFSRQQFIMEPSWAILQNLRESWKIRAKKLEQNETMIEEARGQKASFFLENFAVTLKKWAFSRIKSMHLNFEMATLFAGARGKFRAFIYAPKINTSAQATGLRNHIN